MTHRIRLDGSGLRFAAAHMAIYEGDCEPLHGHNYAVTVEISGALTEDSWVLDFGRARELVADICTELDHKFLLQMAGRQLRIEQNEGAYTIAFGSRRYVMPVRDVAPLPIDNTTAERIAEWFASRIDDALRQEGPSTIESLTVGVDEAPGQSGWYTLRLTPH